MFEQFFTPCSLTQSLSILSITYSNVPPSRLSITLLVTTTLEQPYPTKRGCWQTISHSKTHTKGEEKVVYGGGEIDDLKTRVQKRQETGIYTSQDQTQPNPGHSGTETRKSVAQLWHSPGNNGKGMEMTKGHDITTA